MTTTAYDTAAILRQNVADLERELQRQRERAEKAEAELRMAREQKPAVKYVSRRMSPDGTKECWGFDIGDELPEGTLLYARPIPAPAPAPAHADDDAIMRVCEAVADALGNAYDCTRVWSAWSYGTMGPDDFWLVRESDDRIREIADAAIMALLQSATAAPAVPDELRDAVSDMLASDGADGGRYDANKWLAARDRVRALLQSAGGRP